MALRFNKRIKIAPGIRVNVGKRGASLSVGGRGASVNIGSRGVYGNVGIPGTGVSYRSKLNNSARVSQRRDRELVRQEQAERRQAALAKVQLSLKENGALEIIDAFGQTLGRRDTQLLWEQQGDYVLDWLQSQAELINGDSELLADIYLDTIPPDSEPEYLKQAFQDPKPTEPAPPQLPKLGWIARLFKSKRAEHEAQVNSIQSKYEYEVAEFNRSLSGWKGRKRQFEQEEDRRALVFPQEISKDVGLMEEYLSAILESLDWPRETLIDFDVQQGGSEIWLDVDLPEIEDIPERIAALADPRKKLSIKRKPKTQHQLEYAKHVHGIVFRLLGATFASIPSAQRVIISGYSQRLDTATGITNDDYLLSVSVQRDEFSGIDFSALENVDPIVALERFQLTRKMTKAGMFKAIEPISPEKVA